MRSSLLYASRGAEAVALERRWRLALGILLESKFPSLVQYSRIFSKSLTLSEDGREKELLVVV